MHINEDHLYHGPALTQIAEWPTFKAINAFEPKKGEKSRSAFTVNHDTGIYLKYASKPVGPFKGIHVFTFTEANLAEVKKPSKLIMRGYSLFWSAGRLKRFAHVLTDTEFETHRQRRGE